MRCCCCYYFHYCCCCRFGRQQLLVLRLALLLVLVLLVLLLLDVSNVATGPDTESGGDGAASLAGALWIRPWPEALNPGSAARRITVIWPVWASAESP